jgi:hypothetical protein
MVLSQDRQLGYDRWLAWLRAGGVLADGILGLAGEAGAVDDLDGLLREIDRLKGWLDAFRPFAIRVDSSVSRWEWPDGTAIDEFAVVAIGVPDRGDFPAGSIGLY